ncbi:hypothetical protein ACWCXB_21035 [Streptomyces sp. NPDC001514]
MQPQQPHSALVPPTSPTPPPRRPWGTMVGALMIGLLIGGGAVGAAWTLSDESGGNTNAAASGPAGDARAACGALDGFEESEYAAKGPEGDVALNRWAAAGALSASAAAGDTKYEPLAKAIRQSQTRHAQVFEFDAKVKKDLAEARRICKDL